MALSNDLDKTSLMVNFLFEIHIQDQSFYYTDCPFDLVYEEQRYSCSNIVKKFDNVKESAKLDSKGIKIVLVGLDETIRNLFISTNALGSQIKLIAAFREGNRITSTYNYFDGVVKSAKFKSAKNSDLTITTSTRTNLDFKASSRTNNSEQTARFPNDNFYKYSTMTEMEVKWQEKKE
ncbi:hypothetical protein [Shewanella sp.]|uniref:hypothetical protein n=1 Tax=Shewanella sp. TaxID=50422 RepID=UPI00404770E7